jgi:hypothetical protein
MNWNIIIWLDLKKKYWTAGWILVEIFICSHYGIEHHQYAAYLSLLKVLILLW